MARKEYSIPDIMVITLPDNEDVMTESMVNYNYDLNSGEDYNLPDFGA